MQKIRIVPQLPEKLFRYSKKAYLEDSIKHGRFRLNSASYIASLEGDRARQDTETHVEYSFPKNRVTVSNATTGQVIPTIDGVHFQSSIETDYYLLSFTKKNESYMFEEFSGADSCLVIHDPSEFQKRMYRASNLKLPSWAGIDAHITYGGPSDYGAPFEKPFRYIFQWEWRFAWIPGFESKTQNNLPCIFLDIGSIEDIAEIVGK